MTVEEAKTKMCPLAAETIFKTSGDTSGKRICGECMSWKYDRRNYGKDTKDDDKYGFCQIIEQ